MGAGRKTQTYGGYSNDTNRPSYRLLSRTELGGVIFGTSTQTIKECIDGKVFGLPMSHMKYIKNVCDGLPLFLFNYSERKMYGVFEADGPGGSFLKPDAWAGGGGDSPYPAQVRVRVRAPCIPLPESAFRSAIEGNYYAPSLFNFELDQQQTTNLIALFMKRSARGTPPQQLPARPAAPAVVMEPLPNAWGRPPRSTWNSEPPRAAPRTSHAPTFENGEVVGAGGWGDGVDKSAGLGGKGKEESASKDKGWGEGGPSSDGVGEVVDEEDGKGGAVIAARHQGSTNANASTGPAHDRPQKNNRTALPSSSLTSANDSSTAGAHASPDMDPPPPAPSQKEPASSDTKPPPTPSNPNPAAAAAAGGGEASLDMMVLLKKERVELARVLAEVEGPIGQTINHHVELCAAAIGQMRSDSTDLHHVMASAQIEIRANQSVHAENAALKARLAILEAQVQTLLTNMGDLSRGFQNDPSATSPTLTPATDPAPPLAPAAADVCAAKGERSGLEHAEGDDVEAEVEVEVKEEGVEVGQIPASSILLLGGFNGTDWLGSAELFNPKDCTTRALAGMGGMRSYAAAAVRDGGVMVFGGGNGEAWYDSVELYNFERASWQQGAPMQVARGSLGGATLFGHTYALGGGTNTTFFDDVEWFDPSTDKWHFTVSMNTKRFCLASVAMNNAIYCVGGYNGSAYLKSMERFDPRHGAWQACGSMSHRRGSLSACHLKDKLYALGGFNGQSFLNTVEVYDPRADRWQMAPRMQSLRAYGGAGVLEDTLYCIGGLGGGNLVDQMECYTEENGWKSVPNPCASLRRSFLTAVVI